MNSCSCRINSTMPDKNTQGKSSKWYGSLLWYVLIFCDCMSASSDPSCRIRESVECILPSPKQFISIMHKEKFNEISWWYGVGRCWVRWAQQSCKLVEFCSTAVELIQHRNWRLVEPCSLNWSIRHYSRSRLWMKTKTNLCKRRIG